MSEYDATIGGYVRSPLHAVAELEAKLEAAEARIRELEEALGKVYKDSLTAHVHGGWTNLQLVESGGPYALNWRIHETARTAVSTPDPEETP